MSYNGLAMTIAVVVVILWVIVGRITERDEFEAELGDRSAGIEAEQRPAALDETSGSEPTGDEVDSPVAVEAGTEPEASGGQPSQDSRWSGDQTDRPDGAAPSVTGVGKKLATRKGGGSAWGGGSGSSEDSGSGEDGGEGSAGTEPEPEPEEPPPASEPEPAAAPAEEPSGGDEEAFEY
ncbi:MAG: hypothetical protein A2284_09055 [Deltaproteobacteria bacterium RIFOXYA12_FULL_61_11]|nr:MAG: hypothetical protein A2284_09055 [Deltaproteobacteria bacterium RIFOXYA12_FULL_61_11]